VNLAVTMGHSGHCLTGPSIIKTAALCRCKLIVVNLGRQVGGTVSCVKFLRHEKSSAESFRLESRD
jgi:hypothetical protein